jgi:NAD(P)-dependent dehydrogenase (short-subunit alcohol dehydrogenase family)
VASKLILITGCSKGLGLAMVRSFAALGHTIIGCARSTPAIASLQKEFPAPHSFAEVDVSDASAVEAWAGNIIASHGAPDLLLNNAAVIHPNAPFWKVPVDRFDRVIDVNVKGLANVLRSFLPAMVKAKKGVVVNFSSGWGRSTSPEVSGYCASKYAVEGLTSSLAQELPVGMAAVALNPGVINTEMLQDCFGKESASHYPSAEEWAKRAVPFLLQIGPKDNGHPLTVPGIPTD